MSLANNYSRYVSKDASYVLSYLDDVATFIIASPATATLPLSKLCTIPSGQNQKIIINDTSSSSTLTIAVGSGDTLVGATAAGPAVTLAAGETAYCYGNQATIWNITGGAATSGVSGYSGFSGYSGYSGTSGFSGFSGYSGFSGFSGFSGYSGYSGDSGYSGVSGYSGFSGKSGYSGFSGYSGYTGI